MKLIIVFVIAFMMPFFANAMDWNDYYQLQQNKLLQQQAEYQRQQLEIQQRTLDLQRRQYHQQQQWQQNRSLPDYTIRQQNFFDSVMQGFEAGRIIQQQKEWNK
jgi:transcriptional regulator with AAA-type ATPase domain